MKARAAEGAGGAGGAGGPGTSSGPKTDELSRRDPPEYGLTRFSGGPKTCKASHLLRLWRASQRSGWWTVYRVAWTQDGQPCVHTVLEEDLEGVWEAIRPREFLQSFHVRSRWADLQELDHLVHSCRRPAEHYIHGAVETVSYATVEPEPVGLAACPPAEPDALDPSVDLEGSPNLVRALAQLGRRMRLASPVRLPKMIGTWAGRPVRRTVCPENLPE